ncbi:uvs-1 [Pristionchus pacificus]|uniref:UV-stimulated scaffold protein A C-terminal domain-containing protein n=1 Tax=Pristionchus pacificus TaxID=54126 RepID=A0A8R1V7J8_PRIPA|nr:uvs-1 [Pristionchus pacificus]
MDEKRKTLHTVISRLVKEIEDSKGELNIESALFSTLKDRVKCDVEDSRNCVEILLEFLKFNSSHTRRCALPLIDFFYMKSPRFREHVNNFLFEIILNAAEIEPLKKPLPPPKEDAIELKIACIKMFQKWDEKFGKDTRLKLAVKNLRDATTLDYDRVSGETAVERIARDEKQRKEEEYGRTRMAEVSEEFACNSELIKRNVCEAKELLLILVPSFIDEEKPSTSNASDPQEHGYGMGDSFTVQINNPVPEIVTDDSNIDVVTSAIDVLKQLVVHKKKVDGWVRIATRYCKDSSINQYIRLRNLVKSEMDKLIELSLRLPMENPSDGEDEDEFIDVPDEIVKKEQVIEQFGTSKDSPSKSIRKVEFGLDLKYWGQKKRIAQVPVNNADCHRFWRPPDESEERNDRAEAYDTRVFTYIGEEQRGKKKCGARLKNGELCSRMDVARCPIHGKIIDRDHEGFPIEEQVDMQIKRNEMEDYDDDYMDDLEAQIGRSLRGKGTKKNKRNKKEGNDRSGKAVRERLEAKLLNPRTIKRVSAVLEEMRMAKIQKKFGDQHAHRNL